MTGSRVSDFSDPRVRELLFLAICPAGKAIYHSGETYWFLDLGKRFEGEPVTRPIAGAYPEIFFTDR